MTNTTVNPPELGHLLWLGAGSLAQEFSRLSTFTRWSYRWGVRRNSSKTPSGFTPLAADFTDTETLACLATCPADHVVVSLTPPQRSDEGYRLGYFEASRNIIDQLSRWPRPPKRVVFVSSTSVYGQDQGESVDESSPTQPPGFSGQRMLQAEQAWQASGWPVTIVRFSGIYGPGRYRLLQQVQSGIVGGQRRPAYTNRIHQTDCARVIAHLLDDGQDTGTYIATDNESQLDVTVRAWLAEQLGGSVVAPTLTESTAGKRLSNKKLRATGFALQYASFREGYPDIVRSFKANQSEEN